MNIFRFAADMTHLLSIFLLLFKITQSRTVEGDLFVFLCMSLIVLVNYEFVRDFAEESRTLFVSLRFKILGSYLLPTFMDSVGYIQ